MPACIARVLAFDLGTPGKSSTNSAFNALASFLACFGVSAIETELAAEGVETETAGTVLPCNRNGVPISLPKSRKITSFSPPSTKSILHGPQPRFFSSTFTSLPNPRSITNRRAPKCWSIVLQSGSGSTHPSFFRAANCLPQPPIFCSFDHCCLSARSCSGVGGTSTVFTLDDFFDGVLCAASRSLYALIGSTTGLINHGVAISLPCDRKMMLFRPPSTNSITDGLNPRFVFSTLARRPKPCSITKTRRESCDSRSA